MKHQLWVIPLLGISLFLFVVIVFFSPGGASKEDAKRAMCMSNLKQLSLASLAYSEDNDARLPPRDSWMDATLPYARANSILHCPELNDPALYGYAFNSNLELHRRSIILDQEKTPLLFESVNMAKNASDPVISLPKKPRHNNGRNNIAFVDGHVRAIAP